MARDNTQYLFNGSTYGKGRLVHAVVSQFIRDKQPTVEQLKLAFPKELQGSFGVFFTEQEYKARKETSNDQTERFFNNTEDRLTTAEGVQILVCTEWGKDNATKFVNHSKTLGFVIKVDSQVLTDEEIIQHFVHKPAFEGNYKNWPEEVLSAFCELMRVANQTGLDIYFTNSTGGYPLRLGRKGDDHSVAIQVCIWCKLKTNTVMWHVDKDIELSSASVKQVIESGMLSQFSQKFPIKRQAHWPSEYRNEQPHSRIWKVSHSPTVLKAEELEWLSENELLAVHKDTGNGSVPCFKQMTSGDIVSLGYGNQVVRLVRVVSEIETVSDSPLGDEWLLRSYEVIKCLDKPVKYKGEHKRWSPRFPGTSWEVPTNEYLMFEQEILVPYYHLTLKELGFDISQLDKSQGDKPYIVEHQNIPMNQILYGPPGTGKTYHSIEAAVKAAEPKQYSELDIDESVGANAEQRELLTQLYKTLFDTGRIRFVTFHQSYGYEEFVEGLSAKTEGDQLSYFEKDGVFKSLCEDAKVFRVGITNPKSNSFDDRWQVLADNLAESEAGIKIDTLSKKTHFTITDVSNNTIRFDKSKGNSVHTLSVKTLKAAYNNEKIIKGGLQPYYGAIIEYLNQIDIQGSAHQVERKNFVLIIDEINRGNISKIFGELITLIEPSKRLGQKECIEAVLPYTGDKFSVPDNVFIIGTMNTADRSLAMMDTALRRRFDFVEMMPKPVLFTDVSVQGIKLDALLSKMNERIEVLYDREHALGHAFFIPVVDTLNNLGETAAFVELQNVFKNKIIPLLEEYFFEDWNKIRLVLGDNRKTGDNNPFVFINQKQASYDSIFGTNHGLETYENKKTTYSLTDFNDEAGAWQSPKAYQAIYDHSVLKLTEQGPNDSQNPVND